MEIEVNEAGDGAMKEVNETLQKYLNERQRYVSCDLYEFVLANGERLYYTDFDIDVIADNHTFRHDGPIFKRNQIKLQSSMSVDKLDVTMYVTDVDKLHTEPLMQIAHNGGLDGGELTLKRAFFGDDNAIIGTVPLFTGSIEIRQGGGLTLQLWVKSEVQKLNVAWPTRKFYPSCPYSLYGARCGVDIKKYRKDAVVQTVESDVMFTVSVDFAAGYYDMGGVEWLTGALAGQVSPIKKSYDGRRIEILVPAEAIPAAGDRMKIYPGCDKQPETCRQKFNNWARNCATPYVPKKESVL